MNASPPRSTAAFVRVEETLLPAHDVREALYRVLNAPGQGRRLGRIAALAGAAPALATLRLLDRARARRLAALQSRGLTADRIALLAEEYAARLLEPDALRPEGREVIARARGAGHRVVLLTSGLADALAPLRELVGADALLGQRLELRDGRATGRLLGSWGQPGWVAEYARGERIALEGSYAYGADAADLELLHAVGFPCAVNPDRRLRRAAEAAGWPLLYVERGAHA